MYRLTKLAADGSDLPADATGHLAVRLEHDLLARPIIWTAHRSPKALTRKQAKAWAEALGVYNWRWRLPTAEEAFFLPDRSRKTYPLVDTQFFPDCDGEWIWTDTDDLVPPAGYAWGVSLDDGDSLRDHFGGRFRARAVCAGQ